MGLFQTPDPPQIQAPAPPAIPESDPTTAARARKAIEGRRVSIDDLIINPAISTPSGVDLTIPPRM